MYVLTQKNIGETEDARTSKHLPAMKEIPDDFWAGNIYTKIIEAWYTGDKGPPALYVFNAGFEQNGPKVKKLLMNHLSNFDEMYEYRIAGVAYMLSKVFTITEKK